MCQRERERERRVMHRNCDFNQDKDQRKYNSLALNTVVSDSNVDCEVLL